MSRRPKNIMPAEWNSVDSPELSDERLSRMRPVKETHPEIPHRVRGPQKAPVKIPVSLRLSPDVVAFFKSKGKGWQTRINAVLAEYIKSHKNV